MKRIRATNMFTKFLEAMIAAATESVLMVLGIAILAVLVIGAFAILGILLELK